MIDFTYDDGGRRDSGRKGSAGDCVVRAISIALGVDGFYDAIYKNVADEEHADGRSRSARNGVRRGARDRVLDYYGFVKIRLPRGARPTYTEAYERYGKPLSEDAVIVKTRGHVAAIVGGELRDTFDGRTYLWTQDMDPDEVVWQQLSHLPPSARLDSEGLRVAARRGEGIQEVVKRERKATSIWIPPTSDRDLRKLPAGCLPKAVLEELS